MKFDPLLKGSLMDEFPALLVPDNGSDDSLHSLLHLIREKRASIRGKVVEHGALLLRGWKLANAQDFASVVEALGYTSMDYKHGGGARKHILGPVFTANEDPVDKRISFHNEMAYLTVYPDVIMFFCEQPSPRGGGTALVNGELVYQRLAKEMPEIFNLLQEKRICYRTGLPKKWEEAFQTTDKAIAQKRAEAIGARLEWKADGSDHDEPVAYRGPFSATVKHPVKGSMAWFNSICLVQDDPVTRGVAFGDGSPIPVEELDKIATVLQEEQVVLDWQKGDVVIVDNLSVMHCRLPGEPPRVVLVSLIKGY
ncbi:clavaminate synthase-like protein At3g21360 [Selaginella moellendorffii]|nr:clavaminate synthase-like protein At3g21360 [Selaginella moellendorffii]|eukprot:XP_002983066.2 clavaminate synthase-like protein At3g21360 [Selaginella moellendorffii]